MGSTATRIAEPEAPAAFNRYAAEGHAVVAALGDGNPPAARHLPDVGDCSHRRPARLRASAAARRGDGGSRYVEIEGDMVLLTDQMPERFAEVVGEFLHTLPT